VLVIVEGAYSMDGDIAPLPDLVAVCRSHGARLLVDEAHAFGVHGSRGGGVTEHFGMADSVDLIAGTFSKSLGSVGGFVAGDADVITYLRYMCRRSVFSATTPAALVAGVLAALDIMQTDHARRTRLWQNVRYLRDGLIRVGARVLGDGTASVPVHIGADGLIFRFTEDLMRAGVFTFPAVYPTVPRGHSLFRLAVQSAHETSHLDRAIDVFGDLLRKYDVHAH
jgi:glycine C-acetyltransferase